MLKRCLRVGCEDGILMKRLPRGYEARRHVMSCNKGKKYESAFPSLVSFFPPSQLALTWSSDAPVLSAKGTKKKSKDMGEMN